MARYSAAIALLILASVAVAAAPAAHAQKPRMSRVSVANDGSQANGISTLGGVSADGRYVVFSSTADNLVEGDTNGLQDIFVRDRVAGTTVRANLSNDKAQTTGASAATGASFDPSISDDGRFVAFASNASNLVDGDTNDASDVFVRDLQSGVTILVSVGREGGPGNGASDSPAISGDGTTVAFSSSASDLVSGDTNNRPDGFVRDITEKDRGTAFVSIDSDEREPRGIDRGKLGISKDGTRIVFTSQFSGLVSDDRNGNFDIFLRDTAAGTTTLVNVTDAGEQTVFWASERPAISADGGTVAYNTPAENLVTPDSRSTNDVFVYDVDSRKVRRASESSSGERGNDASTGATLSGDGRLVAFESVSTNLVAGFLNSSSRRLYLNDAKGGATQFAAWSISGGAPDSHASAPVLSADGGVLAFTSTASNIVAGDTNGGSDVFVNDLRAPSPGTLEVLATSNSLRLSDGRMASSSWTLARAGNAFTIKPIAPTALPGMLPNSGCSGSSDLVTCISAFPTMSAQLHDGNDRVNVAGCDATNAGGGIDGGDGADILVGSNGDDTLLGGPGNDRFIGCAGRDLILGGPGFDRLDYPGSTPVRIDISNEHESGAVGEQDRIGFDVEHVVTGSGNDTLQGDGTLDGGAGNDNFIGQGGASVMIGGPGTDRIDGRSGADVLMTRDGVADTLINCGTEIDRADLDLLDTQTGCENVTQGAVGERPNVELRTARALKLLRGGVIPVVVACPRAVRHPCAGTLVAARTVSGLRGAPKTRYSVRAGRRATVRVRAHRSVRRGARAYLQSVEKGDVRGVKTTRSYARIAR